MHLAARVSSGQPAGQRTTLSQQLISTIPQAQPDRQLTCASLCASLCVCVSRACGAARWACPSSAPSRSQWAPSWKRLERRQPSDGAAREGRVAGSCWSAAPAPRGMTGHVASSCWIWSPAPLPSTLPLASPRHGRPPEAATLLICFLLSGVALFVAQRLHVA